MPHPFGGFLALVDERRFQWPSFLHFPAPNWFAAPSVGTGNAKGFPNEWAGFLSMLLHDAKRPSALEPLFRERVHL